MSSYADKKIHWLDADESPIITVLSYCDILFWHFTYLALFIYDTSTNGIILV